MTVGELKEELNRFLDDTEVFFHDRYDDGTYDIDDARLTTRKYGVETEFPYTKGVVLLENWYVD